MEDEAAQGFQGTSEHGKEKLLEHGNKSCVSDILGNREHQKPKSKKYI